MKQYKYIKIATHKLKNDKRRASIEAELFDHMEEKKQHLLEIGYDDEQSDSITERAMGDGFEICEQLYAQERHRRGVWYEVILNIVTILFISFLAEINYSSISDFFKFELTFLAFALMLVCLFMSSRRRQNLNIYMVVFGGIVTSDQLAQRLVLAIPSLDIYFARITIAAYLVAFCIFSLVMQFKINRMKYSRKDMTVEKVVNAIHIGVIVLIAAVMFIVCFNTVNNYQKDIQAAKEELTQADEILLDNLDNFMMSEDFSATLKSTFGEYTDIANLEENESRLVTCSVCADKDVYVEKKKENPFYLGMNKAPFDESLNFILADVSDLKVNPDTKVTDMPLPANIGYYSGERGIYLYFTYDEYGRAYNNFDYFEDWSDYFLFAYDEKTKDFVLIDSDLLDKRVDTKLTSEQQDTLKELCIKWNNYCPNAKLNIYNVSEITDAKLKNIYAIELGVCYYAVNEKGIIVKKEILDGYRILAQLDGKNSRIITQTKLYYKSDEKELNTKLITTTGLKNYRNADPYWHKNIDTSSAIKFNCNGKVDKAVMEMLSSMSEATSDSPSLDDCINAFFADYGSSDTFIIDGYSCSAYLSDIDGREKFYFDLSMELVLSYDLQEFEDIYMQIVYEPDEEIRQFMEKYANANHEWDGIITGTTNNEKGEIKANIRSYAIYEILKNKSVSDVQIDWLNWENAA